MKIEQKSEVSDQEVPWAKISAVSGAVGLVLSFTPWLSIVGLALCLFAIVAAIFARKKSGSKLWRRIGLVLGSIGLLALLGVIGLMNFF